MAGEPILLVDDNAANRKLVRVLLQSEGYEVRTAEDADSALAVLRSFQPRLILMDVQLPGTDGLTLTRHLKANPAFADVPIVALTAYAMKGDAEKALACGCADYITKPIDTRSFLLIVASLLRQSAATVHP